MKKRLTMTWLFGVTACGGSPAPDAQTAGTSAPAESPPASTVATPTTSPTTSTAASATRPASPFHVIGELPAQVRLFGAGERGFVTDNWGFVYALVGDDVIHDPLLQRGFSEDPMFSFQGIEGNWPDAAWLSTTHPSGRSGFTKLWQWDGKRWVTKQSTSESRIVFGIRPWIGGRQLAVEQAMMMFDASFRVVSGDKKLAIPAFTKQKNVQSFCYTGLMVQAFDTLPSGEVFTAGLQCSQEEAVGLGVARWAAGAKSPTIDELPGTNGFQDRDTNLTIVGMAVRSTADIWVSAEKIAWKEGTDGNYRSTYLAHFDGSRWQEIPSKIPGAVETLSLSSDRSLLVTNDRGELYAGSSFDTLARIPLPKELFKGDLEPHVTSIWSHAQGDLWVIVNLVSSKAPETDRSTGKYYLLHTRPALKALPTLEEVAQKERAFRLPGPPVEWCTTPFVLLYTLGKKAPADYDYPSTRTALKGHKEFAVEGVEFIEFERTGSRFFGARVPDFKLGKRLAALVKDKVPGSTPELVCHDPPPLRTLSVDLK